MTTATGLRKDLFRVLDGVVQGADVEFLHKGTLIRIVAVNRGSRLARLVHRGDAPAWRRSP